MRKLLIRIFIKNYNDYENPKVRTAYGKLSGAVGLLTNLLLSIVKIVTGFLIGSLAITADGINNLSDAASSIITLIGFKVSSLPADEDHPYGHQRIEYIAGLIVSVIVLVVGGILFKSSIEKIISPSELNFDNLTLIMLGFSILLKIWQSRFYRKNGKLIKSRTLITTAVDSRNDSFQTAAVLLACLIYRYAAINIDGYISFLVSIMIIISGMKLIKETASPLIGEAPSTDFVEKVSAKIQSYPGVLGLHDLEIHTYGPGQTFITVHVEVDSRLDISLSHERIDKIETDFKNDDNINLVIHMDPVEMDDEDSVRLKELTKKIIEEIDPSLGLHGFRILKDKIETKLFFYLLIPNSFHFSVDDLKAEITKRIKEVDQSLNPVITVDLNYC